MKLPWILLIISMLFNVAFISGAIYHRIHRPGPPRFKEMLEPKWKALMDESKGTIDPYRDDAFESRGQFMDALSNPDTPEDSLNAALERSIRKQELLERKVGERMLEIRHTLPPAEYKQFFNRLHKLRPDDMHPRKDRRDHQDRPDKAHCGPMGDD
jgi:hypothetical protein